MGAATRLSGAALALLALAACTGSSDDVGAVARSSTTVVSTTASSAPTTTATVPAPTDPPTPTLTDPTTIPPGVEPPALFHDGSPMIRFAVAVGDGIDLTRDELAAFVVETLGDGRSWIGRGAGFELVEEGAEVTIIVAQPADVDEMCAPLRTNGIFSCARNGWIALNSLRWFGATDDWPGDLLTYRRYLINHEIGHYIVGPAHDSCPAPGLPAPVMMQQTKGLDGCEPNGWVDP